PSAALNATRLIHLVLLSLIAVPALLLAGCTQEGDAETGDGAGSGGEGRQVTLMAGFRAQANRPFLAAYLADAEGFFADEGLAVEIQHSSGQDEHLKLLLDGEVDFTTGTAAQAVRRVQEDLPVRAIALFGQRGDQGYVSLADSGIETPSDFAGHS